MNEMKKKIFSLPREKNDTHVYSSAMLLSGDQAIAAKHTNILIFSLLGISFMSIQLIFILKYWKVKLAVFNLCLFNFIFKKNGIWWSKFENLITNFLAGSEAAKCLQKTYQWYQNALVTMESRYVALNCHLTQYLNHFLVPLLF